MDRKLVRHHFKKCPVLSNDQKISCELQELTPNPSLEKRGELEAPFSS